MRISFSRTFMRPIRCISPALMYGPAVSAQAGGGSIAAGMEVKNWGLERLEPQILALPRGEPWGGQICVYRLQRGSSAKAK